jgi:two-component system response regulator FixJ
MELQDVLNERGIVIPVVFVTGHGDVPMAVEAMKQGAFDFLQKPFRDQELIDCVQRAIGRDREYRESLAQADRIRARIATLTARERDVMRMLIEGNPNKVMAAKLGLSQRTVEIHRAHVMDKMGVRSLAQLVRMVMAVPEHEQPPQPGPAT